MDPQTVPYQPGVLLRGGHLSGGVSKLIFFLLSLRPKTSLSRTQFQIKSPLKE